MANQSSTIKALTQTTPPRSLGTVPVTRWVLPFASEQSESNKCATAAALRSTAFHVRHSNSGPYLTRVPPKSRYFPPAFPARFSRRRGGSRRDAGTPSGVPRSRHPPGRSLAYSGQGSGALRRSKRCVPRLVYMYMRINCGSSILECFTMRRIKLPKEVGKVNVLIK